jgi:hypothetical protein
MLVDTLMPDIMREKRRRMDRALMMGSRKRRNSWQRKLVNKGKSKCGPVTYSERVPDHLTVHKFVANISLYESV